ncbi:MAG: PaaI family thioesterase [Myxococcota bacterium]
MTREELVAYLAAVDATTIHGTLGIRMERVDAAETVVAVDVSDRLFQHAGIVHGGLFVLLAESAASLCAAVSGALAHAEVAGMEINANHLRKVTQGTLRATARPLHRGTSSHVYSVEVANDGTLVCIARCTIAVRPRPQMPR